MKIAVLGTGMVGRRIGTGLVQNGHHVRMGSRSPQNESATQWAAEAGSSATHGTFEDAAKFGEIAFLCVKGEAALDVIRLAGQENLKGKTVVDVTNPLDFSKGMPPALYICNHDSLGEEVQRHLLHSNVVKTLNIVSNELMTEPTKSGGDPTMFLCGNSLPAKESVRKILLEFGWKDIIDLGDITNARGMEMILPIWLRTWGALQNGNFAFKVLRQ